MDPIADMLTRIRNAAMVQKKDVIVPFSNPNLGIINIFQSEGFVKAHKVVSYDKLEQETIQWSQEILEKSPMAIRVIKSALNADCDGQSGLQQLAGDATLMFYMTEEAQEGRDAFKEKRKPNFKKFPRLP